ncbi:hypothetical protein HDV00_012295 [Rhizophlyctis rosea]|nr:hypothetical protein HDV00_012295 [Rhizophlyctis rosea]
MSRSNTITTLAISEASIPPSPTHVPAMTRSNSVTTVAMSVTPPPESPTHQSSSQESFHTPALLSFVEEDIDFVLTGPSDSPIMNMMRAHSDSDIFGSSDDELVREATPTPLPRPVQVHTPSATPLPQTEPEVTDAGSSSHPIQSVPTTPITDASPSHLLTPPASPSPSKPRLTRIATKIWTRSPPTLPRLLTLSSVPTPIRQRRVASATPISFSTSKPKKAAPIKRTYFTRHSIRTATKFGNGGEVYTRLKRTGSETGWHRSREDKMLRSVKGGKISKRR